MVYEEKVIREIRKYSKTAFTTAYIVENIDTNSTQKDIHSEIRKLLEQLYRHNYLSSDKYTKKMKDKKNVKVNRYYITGKLDNTRTDDILEDIK